MILPTILVGLVFFSKHQIVYSLDCYIEKDGRKIVDYIWAEKEVDKGKTKNAYNLCRYNQDSTRRCMKVDDITSESSVIGEIFSPIYANPSDYNYIQFSDVPPGTADEIELITNPIPNKKSISRGAFIWHHDSKRDSKRALLFLSTVPKFLLPFESADPSSIQTTPNRYTFPESYKRDRQMFFCVTFNSKHVKTVLKHLLFRNLLIYGKRIDSEYDDVINNVQSILNDHKTRKEKGEKIAIRLEDDLGTLNGKKTKIITKTSKVKLGLRMTLKKIMKRLPSNPSSESTDNQIIASSLVINEFKFFYRSIEIY